MDGDREGDKKKRHVIPDAENRPFAFSLSLSPSFSRARARLLTFRVFAFFMFSRAAACDSLPLSSPLTFSLTLSFFSAIRFHRYRISYSDRDINAHNEFRIIFRINRLFFSILIPDTIGICLDRLKWHQHIFLWLLIPFVKCTVRSSKYTVATFARVDAIEPAKILNALSLKKKMPLINIIFRGRTQALAKLNQFSLRLQSSLMRL